MVQTIAVFDFLSHTTMHLPFNAGYLKVLLQAFPDDKIIFFGDAGHIENLKFDFPDEPRLSFHTAHIMNVQDKRNHNPLSGNKAATDCFLSVIKNIDPQSLRIAAMSGADANLLRIFRKKWGKFSSAPLHYVLHNHLAASFAWRSRNPYYRFFDFMAEFKRGLPSAQKWIALEKGIQISVEKLVPKLKGSVISLPHPITFGDGSSVSGSSLGDGPIKVAFLGHCSAGKGFDYFVELANEFSGPNYEFWAIGRADPSQQHLDTSKLVHQPTDGYLAADEYYQALSKIDMAVLPLNEGYNYVASGSVLDAISHLKPTVMLESLTYKTIADDYGSYGPMVSDKAAIRALFLTSKKEHFAAQFPAWKKTLFEIRAHRTPEWLAQTYRKTIPND